MNIPDDLKQLLTDEFEEIARGMAESSTVGDKLYFFSAAYGSLNRIMNFTHEPVLVFAHQVFQTAHQNLQGRLMQPRGPDDHHLDIPVDFMAAAQQLVVDFRAALLASDQSEIYAVLERTASLGYAATGNGYYMYLRGRITIPKAP